MRTAMRLLRKTQESDWVSHMAGKRWVERTRHGCAGRCSPSFLYGLDYFYLPVPRGEAAASKYLKSERWKRPARSHAEALQSSVEPRHEQTIA